MQRLLLTLVIALGVGSQSSAVLINTRMQAMQFIELDEGLELNLRDHFQIYADPGPIATIHFDLPIQDPNPDTENGFWTFEIATDISVELMRYQLIDGSTYDSPFDATAEDMKFVSYSVDYQLLGTDAPTTVGNFISYAREGAYEGSLIHRSEISVVQGGAYKLHQGQEGYILDLIEPRDPIIFEETKNNTAGTLSMARQTALDTATSQYFINLEDNSQVFGSAYAVFGELVDPENDLPILQQMGDVPVYNLTPYYSTAPFSNIPLFAPFFQDQASYLQLSSIDIPEGDPDGISYAWEFYDTDEEVSEEEALDRAAFSISMEGSNLNISRNGTAAGQVAITVSGTSTDGQSVSFTMDLIGYNEEAIEKFPASTIDASGWIESAWFGWVYADTFPQVIHANHGPQYVYPDGSAFTHYLFDYNLQTWLYTTSTLYPTLFVYALNSWAYYSEGSGDGFGTSRWFYLYDTEVPGWVYESDL